MSVWSLTCFDADVGAPDLAGSILRGAEVVIVVDKAIEGGGGERVELQCPVGVDVPDVRHVVDVVPCGQVPSKGRAGGACSRAGHHHPHGAGKGHLLQGVIYKVEAGADIFRAGCRGGEERGSVSTLIIPSQASRHAKPTPRSQWSTSHLVSAYEC